MRELFSRFGVQKMRVSFGEMQCSCPFPEGHARGDRRPSFSAKIVDGDRSPYFCHGCHAHGTLEWLAYSSGFSDLIDDNRISEVKAKKWLHVPSSNAGIFSDVCVEGKKPVLFRDVYLERFVGSLSGYLSRRGINLETARVWELGVDKEFGRATFTVRDYKKSLALVIGRDVTGKSKVKYSNYVLDRKNGRMVPFIDHSREGDFKSPTKSFFLYGEHLAWEIAHPGERSVSMRGGVPHLIIVEGAIDVLKLWQFGWNAVAVLGSYPSDMQVEKIANMVPRDGRVVVMADGDEAGRKLAVYLGEKLSNRVAVFCAVLPDGVDPGDADGELIDDSFASARMF